MKNIFCKHEIVVIPDSDNDNLFDIIDFKFISKVLSSTSTTKVHIPLYKYKISYYELLNLHWIASAFYELGKPYRTKLILHLRRDQIDDILKMTKLHPDIKNMDIFKFCIDKEFMIKSGKKQYHINSKTCIR